MMVVPGIEVQIEAAEIVAIALCTEIFSVHNGRQVQVQDIEVSSESAVVRNG